jgi:hypothetical protein
MEFGKSLTRVLCYLVRLIGLVASDLDSQALLVRRDIRSTIRLRILYAGRPIKGVSTPLSTNSLDWELG